MEKLKFGEWITGTDGTSRIYALSKGGEILCGVCRVGPIYWARDEKDRVIGAFQYFNLAASACERHVKELAGLWADIEKARSPFTTIAV